jgi:anthranilate synthase
MLADGFDSLDAFQTHMWACTVTGAPKPAALQAIENLENSPRGWFSGAVGFLSFNGNINTGITLRFAQLKNGRAVTRAGATLLFGSEPELEEQETRTKAAAFLSALSKIKDQDRGLVSEEPKVLLESGIKKLKGKTPKVLFVDCRDSFVHNLASYVRELGSEVITMRVGFPIEMIAEIKPDLVLLSPGPGNPDDFSLPSLVGELASRELPLFGVCLGHQGIGQHFGAKLGQLPIPFHGKSSRVTHNSDSLFKDISSPFTAGRYHSLYLKNDSMPDCLEILAGTEFTHSDGTVEVIPMAIRHKTLPIASVQFHPESLMTLEGNVGHLILKNALESLT